MSAMTQVLLLTGVLPGGGPPAGAVSAVAPEDRIARSASIGRWAGSAGRPYPHRMLRPGPWGPGLSGGRRVRVLVVEDEDVMAEMIALGLRRAGHAVDVAGDGAAALERAGQNRYDVVVLDRDLPVISGDEVCRQ